MQTPQWRADFKLGIDDIDRQHHLFLDLIERFERRLSKSPKPEYRRRLINELFYYARFHFLSEENLMWVSGYPDFNAHREGHMRLLDELNYSAAEFDDEQLIEFLVKWFINHTQGDDRQFADWLARQPA